MMRALSWAACCAGLLLLAACAAKVPPNSTFLIFFPDKTATLTAEAGAELDRAAAAIKSSTPLSVTIAAGDGRGESQKLADPRYAAVEGALTKRGVPARLIARGGLPVSDVKTGAVDRVEIILGFSK